MKKIELIWREILETGSKNPVFEQKKLAQKFGFSTSTVFAAVSGLKAIGAVTVTGRNFRLVNFEKALLFWATHRNLSREIIYKTRVELPVLEVEGLVDDKTIYGVYSAARILLGSAPAEYDKVYVYNRNIQVLEKRFPLKKGEPNFFVLKTDDFLEKYGKTTRVSQTFVDLWNLSDWQAGEFLDALKEKFYGRLLQ